jgi:broad specificity phosphatase PhoE
VAAAALPGAQLSGALHLVRHGRPLVDPTLPPAEWVLDPDAEADVVALRERLPRAASWFSSPEPKALATARLLTDDVTVEPALAEHRREATVWLEDAEWRDLVARAFASPDESVHQGWEPLASTRDRLLPVVRRILAEHDGHVVLVGHGTAWTLLRAELTGAPPDLDAWARLRMPDVWVLERPDR